MNNKLIGTLFCMIAAILMSARYVAAAAFMSGSSRDEAAFALGLDVVGGPLKYAALIALAVGICFLIYGIFQELRKGKQ